VVGKEQADLFDMDPLNINYMDFAAVIKSTEAAMDFAYKATGTQNVIIFDGAMSGINVSEPLAGLLLQKAPAVSDRVENELLPKWLRQRGVQV